MTNNLIYGLTLYSALGSGLMAGVFFIFSNTIMASLAQLPVSQGITAMQHINRIILNPLFFIVFLGTAVATFLLAANLPGHWQQPNSQYILVGCLCYLVGALLVTMIFNVPMNNTLKAEDPQTTQAAELWATYLKNWTFWNHVRGAASFFAAIFFILALK